MGNLQRLLSFTTSVGLQIKFGNETSFASGPRLTSRGKPTKRITLTLTSSDISQLETLHQKVASDICHELGHYIAAPKGRRRIKDYGIKIASRFAGVDEDKANFVGDYIANHFGFLKAPKWVAQDDEAKIWWQQHGKQQVDVLLDFLS